jgi:hypothetical protein
MMIPAVGIILTVAVRLAATLTARVVEISDGDTIAVLISGRQQAVAGFQGILGGGVGVSTGASS